jgi:hypothetical protein
MRYTKPMKTRVVAAVLLVLAIVPVWGCASSTPTPRPTARPFDTMRRVAIVASGDSKFTVVEHRAEPGRTFDEVVKWTPYQWLRPLGPLVHAGINWLLDLGRTVSTAADVGGISPRLIVSQVFARRLQSSGSFEEARTLESEPIGEERRRADSIARVTVPAWGLVRVRQGNPDLLSAFADVRAEMVIPDTGVVLWENSEDVTDPERLPLESFTRDRQFARQQLLAVLERAGERLASELLYARGAGR